MKLVKQHGAQARRSWWRLYIGMDADTEQVVAATLTRKEVDGGTLNRMLCNKRPICVRLA